MRRDPHLREQVALETYSVLTRLPPPHRAGALMAERFFAEQFPDSLLTLSGRHRDVLARLSSLGLAGEPFTTPS